MHFKQNLDNIEASKVGLRKFKICFLVVLFLKS